MSEVKHTNARAWALAKNLITDAVVKTNVNGYPFVTFKEAGSPKGKGGLNIYISKDSADTCVALGTIPSDIRAQMTITEYKNEAGEDRIKLALASESSFGAF